LSRPTPFGKWSVQTFATNGQSKLLPQMVSPNSFDKRSVQTFATSGQSKLLPQVVGPNFCDKWSVQTLSTKITRSAIWTQIYWKFTGFRRVTTGQFFKRVFKPEFSRIVWN
jgi:hypothetical protein